LARVPYDYLYAKSNFLCRLAREQWDVRSERIFVAHNGIEAAHYARFLRRPPQRDPFRLVYFSHPSKGLATSLAVLRNLRVKDPRFTLSVYGGDALWGQQQGAPPDDPGASFHGLIGQKALARELFGCGFSLSLQARLEPFGMVITEAMRAGCIVLASPVGAYPELIRDGEDGYLLPGDHESEDVQARAAELILKLAQNPQASAYVRRNAQTMMWDTDTMVRVWLRHWDWWFEGKPLAAPAGGECPQCGGVSLWLADGYHCTVCGIYRRGRTKIETPVDVRE
jgi:glycosyltransferase involved in cell wall biosynthesis